MKKNLRDLIAVTDLVILPKLDSNRSFFFGFGLYDVEIRWMTSTNNRTPPLCCVKLCASCLALKFAGDLEK